MDMLYYMPNLVWDKTGEMIALARAEALSTQAPTPMTISYATMKKSRKEKEQKN